MAAQVSRVLQNRYELNKKLGQGGMGSVYLADDRRLSTVRWAVKELSDAAITSPLERQQAGELFKQEAELLARLNHPHLPRVTDHFQQDGANYLVMEFVPGETLASYIDRVGLPRPIEEVQEWAIQLCEVLNYLHNQNPPIIFRDLKPANIMLTPEGSLKLIDFGIARLFKPGQNKDTQAYGTMGYSAPEQYGRGQTDARSDIYSLAVLIYQLLTGYDPAATPFNLPPANQVNPQISGQIAAILSQATRTNPEERFASISEFRHALFGTGPVHSPTNPQSYSGQLEPPAQKTTWLASSALWIGSISVGVMAVSLITLIIGLMSGNGMKDNLLASTSLIFAALPTITGPLAMIVGVIALARSETIQTTHGRRQATLGVVAGTSTLLLCCVISSILGFAQP